MMTMIFIMLLIVALTIVVRIMSPTITILISIVTIIENHGNDDSV